MVFSKGDNLSIQDKALLENYYAIQVKNKANIEYLAMMTDIDIFDDTQNENEGDINE